MVQAALSAFTKWTKKIGTKSLTFVSITLLKRFATLLFFEDEHRTFVCGKYSNNCFIKKSNIGSHPDDTGADKGAVGLIDTSQGAETENDIQLFSADRQRHTRLRNVYSVPSSPAPKYTRCRTMTNTAP